MGYIFVANAGAGDRHLAKAPKAGHKQNPSRIEKHWTTAFLKIRTPAAHGRRFLSCVGDHLPPAGVPAVPYGSWWSKRGEPNPRSQRGRLMYWPLYDACKNAGIAACAGPYTGRRLVNALDLYP